MPVRTAAASDIPAILHLQDQNLFARVAPSARAAGFVTTPYTAEQVEIFRHEGRVFVAEEAGVVAGYVFGGVWDLYRAWPFFRELLARFPGLPPFGDVQITDTNTFQYGPVCIDADFRGRGLLPQLFGAVCDSYAEEFAVGITMISPWNERSLDAHTRKLGLTIIDSFEYDGRPYHTLAFPTR